MIVTYNKTYREVVMGIDWTLFSDTKLHKDSLIVHDLENFVKTHQSTPFILLYDMMKWEYKHKKVKSRCDIQLEDNKIEVTVRGVFPRFYINLNK